MLFQLLWAVLYYERSREDYVLGKIILLLDKMSLNEISFIIFQNYSASIHLHGTVHLQTQFVTFTYNKKNIFLLIIHKAIQLRIFPMTMAKKFFRHHHKYLIRVQIVWKIKRKIKKEKIEYQWKHQQKIENAYHAFSGISNCFFFCVCVFVYFRMDPNFLM